jgi:citrate synthase
VGQRHARRRQADHGLRPPRLPGRGSALAHPQAVGSPQIEIAERLEEAALAELERRKPDRPLKTNVEYYSALVLDIAEVPPPVAPAMFACSRVAGWSAHILEQKRKGKLFRPSARYVGPGARSLQEV